MHPESTIRRVYENIDRSGGPDACWPYAGRRTPLGYGQTWDNNLKRDVLAHRVVYAVEVGPIPEGIGILHRCNNPPCCNIRHLYAGTQLDNRADCVAAGRAVLPPISTRWGEAVHFAKLTVAVVLTIRARVAAGESHRAIAREYGIDKKSVYNIVHRRTWKKC